MPRPHILTFRLVVSALQTGRYRAAVQQTPRLSTTPRNLTTTFTWPYDDAVVEAIQDILFGCSNLPYSEQVQRINSFGDTLFQLAFADDIRPAFEQSLADAQHHAQYGLHLQLDLSTAGPLRDVPWELLRDRGEMLALNPRIALVRAHAPLVYSRPQPTETGLKMLVFVASPPGLPALDSQRDINLLQQAISSIQHQLQLKVVEDGHFQSLRHHLEEDSYQIVYFIGHALQESETHPLSIAFIDPETSDGYTLVRPEALARELNASETVHLFVAGGASATPALSHALIERGIPAVLEQAFASDEETATIFLQAFLGQLASGATPSLALARSRRILDQMLDNIEWAIPRFYTSYQEESSLVHIPSIWEKPLWRIGLPAGLIALILVTGLLILLLSGDDSSNAQETGQTNLLATEQPAPTFEIAISDFTLSPPQPQAGEPLNLMLTISNRTSNDTGPFTYQIMLNGVKDSIILEEEQIENLEPTANRTIEFAYRPQQTGPFIAIFILRTAEEQEKNRVAIPFIVE